MRCVSAQAALPPSPAPEIGDARERVPPGGGGGCVASGRARLGCAAEEAVELKRLEALY